MQSKEDEETSLNDIISLLKYNTDLNELINTINSYSDDFEFDKENLSIRISSSNFDKFKEKVIMITLKLLYCMDFVITRWQIIHLN